MNVWLDGVEQFRLQQHRGEMQSLDGVSLHHLDDAGREVGPDVAEPPRDPWRGRAQAARSPRAHAILLARVIEGGECGIHLLLLPAEGGIQFLL